MVDHYPNLCNSTAFHSSISIVRRDIRYRAGQEEGRYRLATILVHRLNLVQNWGNTLHEHLSRQSKILKYVLENEKSNDYKLD